jgi:hypothetical protein
MMSLFYISSAMAILAALAGLTDAIAYFVWRW